MKYVALFSGWNDKDWRIFNSINEARDWLYEMVKREKSNFPNKPIAKGWIYPIARDVDTSFAFGH